MAIEVKQASPVLIQSPSFRHGMNDGALWYFHGDTPQRPVTEADVIDFLQGNVVELAGARLFRRGPAAIKHRFSARLDCSPIPSTSCPCRKNVF
jgi:hypothetical protein